MDQRASTRAAQLYQLISVIRPHDRCGHTDVTVVDELYPCTMRDIVLRATFVKVGVQKNKFHCFVI